MRWLALALALSTPALAQDFQPIHEVLSHPRCANCHVGEDGIPLWHRGAGFEPHGLRIQGGESRMGIETTPCGTCHGHSNNPLPGGAPGAEGWALPPSEMQWAFRTETEICEQLRDPARNGGRTLTEVAEHILHDPLVLWGWEPGPGRTPAPSTPDALAEAIRAWNAAGAPCP